MDCKVMKDHNDNNTLTATMSDHEIWCYFNMESRKHGDLLKIDTRMVFDKLLALANKDMLVLRPKYAVTMYKLSMGDYISDTEDVDMLMDYLMSEPTLVRKAL